MASRLCVPPAPWSLHAPADTWPSASCAVAFWLSFSSVVVVIALKLGAVQVSLYGLGRDLIRVLLHQSSAISTDYGMIVVDIRLPRILLAIVVGASLSVAGTSFQALLRNPLADPYVLGISSGAAVGSIVALDDRESTRHFAGVCRTDHSFWRISWRGHHHRRRSISSAAAKDKLTAPLCFSAASSPLPFSQPSSCF